MSRLIAVAARMYALLLRLYAPAFSREFAPSMVEDSWWFLTPVRRRSGQRRA
jgi:hypothetical protein